MSVDYDDLLTRYEPALGLEVHVELNTRTKMFDAAPNLFGDEPNTNTTPDSTNLSGDRFNFFFFFFFFIFIF